METLLIVLGVLILLGIAFLAYLLLRPQAPKDEGSGMLLIQERLSELARTVDAKLGSSQKEVQESLKFQLGESQRLMRDITEQMGRQLLDVRQGVTESTEQSKKVLGITEQLKNLEKVLTHQKQRGSLGEAGLEMILGNVLPPGIYRLQHRFANGDAVDAVIETKDGLIPIDAKFSLDNYLRLAGETDPGRRTLLEQEFAGDLKKRIDETAKYIRPKEGTLPFAIMYIPAEGIYYDLLVNKVGGIGPNARDLIEYAYKDKQVIIVSPTTFVAYLQTVLQGYRAFKIEEQAKEIGANVEKLGRHLSAYDEYHKKLGTALATTVGHYNASRKELGKIDKDVMKIAGTAVGIEQLALEKPEQGDE